MKLAAEGGGHLGLKKGVPEKWYASQMFVKQNTI